MNERDSDFILTERKEQAEKIVPYLQNFKCAGSSPVLVWPMKILW